MTTLLLLAKKVRRPKIVQHLDFSKSLPKVDNRLIGVSSSNLVTLTETLAVGLV
jgi:hypothetical protein